MKILLVNPPNCGRSIPRERYGIDFVKHIFRGEPYALEVLAGTVNDHEVRIVDLKVEPAALETFLVEFGPEIVGFTGVTCEANTVLRLAAQAKAMCNATVVVGGSHASSAPGYFNREQVDYIVVGLAGSSFRELVVALAEGRTPDGIPGVARTRPGKEIAFRRRSYSPADLADDWPPSYHKVSGYRESYTIPALKLKLGFVASAYGCPFGCSFCCIASQAGGRHLTRRVGAVLRDVRLLGDIPVVRLIDANTFADIGHAERLCGAILEEGIQKSFIADIRADTVVSHPALLRRWKTAGLRSVIVGFEEIDGKRLRGWRKGSSTETNLEAIAALHEIGITIVGDFIISPEYGEAEFEALGTYIAKNPIDLPILSVLTPLPGTALYETMKDRILIEDLDYYTLENAILPTRLGDKVFYQRYAELLRLCQSRARV